MKARIKDLKRILREELKRIDELWAVAVGGRSIGRFKDETKAKKTAEGFRDRFSDKDVRIVKVESLRRIVREEIRSSDKWVVLVNGKDVGNFREKRDANKAASGFRVNKGPSADIEVVSIESFRQGMNEEIGRLDGV